MKLVDRSASRPGRLTRTLPRAARGYWEDERTFRFDYDEFADNRLYDIAVRFEQDRATVALREATELFDVTIEAIRDEP